MIISASRRCDIPSHFGKWFVNRLQEGFVLVQNPYNTKRFSKVMLTPEAVDIIVFWTKNPLPFLQYLPKIDALGYPYYFEFTLTPYGKDTERNLPEKEILLDAFITLSHNLGKNRVVWRYDPIVIDEQHNIAYHEEKFSYMARRLCGSTNRCVISFVDGYKNVTQRMGKNPSDAVSRSNVHEISGLFSKIAKENGMEVVTCSEKYNLEKYGVQHGACIDKERIESILGCKIVEKKDKNQREECLCLESIDIGTYNCCANGCCYCYAIQSDKAAAANIEKHNPASPVLIGEAGLNALITNRDTKSVVINQMSFFE